MLGGKVVQESQYVRLNVGGHLYTTTLATLTRKEGMLCSMFSGEVGIKQDSEGYFCIDRDGRLFGLVLDYLRDDHVIVPETRLEREKLLAEARFYCLDGLVHLLEANENAVTPYSPSCTIPLVSSHEELQRIVETSPLPVVLLTLNRNNQFSYTGPAVENMYKNAELFERMAIKFSGKILFCKNVVCSKEICTWAFFAEGEKKKEISCVTMVYSSERPQLKIEFPETRIYEEMLNTVLFAF